MTKPAYVPLSLRRVRNVRKTARATFMNYDKMIEIVGSGRDATVLFLARWPDDHGTDWLGVNRLRGPKALREFANSILSAIGPRAVRAAGKRKP